jgi:hypothetical protein
VSPRRRPARARAAPVTFRGPPNHLTTLVALPEEADRRVAAEARLEGAEVERLAVRPLRSEGLALGRVRIRLPKSTPPGSYPGSVTIAGEEVPFVAEVEPRENVEVVPSHLALEVEPGAEATADVALVNRGNVPFELPAASRFCIFDGGGIDHAFWAALASDPPEGKERIDVLLDDLAESHGGVVEARARAPKRTIAPGEAGEAQVTLRFSDRLQPGRTYAGAWDVGGLHLSIEVTVPERKRTARKATREAR